MFSNGLKMKNKFIKNYVMILFIQASIMYIYHNENFDIASFNFLIFIIISVIIFVYSTIKVEEDNNKDQIKVAVMQMVSLVLLSTGYFLFHMPIIGYLSLYLTISIIISYNIKIFSHALMAVLIVNTLGLTIYYFGHMRDLVIVDKTLVTIIATLVVNIIGYYFLIRITEKIKSDRDFSIKSIGDKNRKIEKLLFQIQDTFEGFTTEDDVDTAKHNKRIGLYALSFAKALNCEPSMIEDIKTGAPLHDIGKIFLEKDILYKEFSLKTEERKYVQTHVTKGYNLIKNLKLGDVVNNIVLHHHERWDGEGYPDNLRAFSIPLEARIIKIADVYDALRSRRTYKKSWSHEKACEFIKENSGSMFDPSLVNVFLSKQEKFFDDIFKRHGKK